MADEFNVWFVTRKRNDSLVLEKRMKNILARGS